MTTTTTARGMRFTHATTLLTEHLTKHALPEPATLSVNTSYGPSTLTAQLPADTVLSLAADLLAWADTLHAVTIEAWRPPRGDRVHLSIHGTLTNPAGVLKLTVYGAVNYDPHHFADLQSHTHRGVSLPLEHLRTWAANPPTTTGTPVLEAHRAEQ